MSALDIWTVYEKPSDYPTKYVARLFQNDKPTINAVFADTLDGVRKKIPPGLYCMPRDPKDDPKIMESWL